MDGPSDNLLARAVGGDPGAVAELLERHGPDIRRGLVGRIPKRWRSLLSEDDILQQTYADAFVGLRRFVSDSEASFARWLAMLARRNLRNAVRMLEAEKRGGDRRRVTGSDDESFVGLYELLARTGSTPSRHVAAAEARAALQDAIARLPADYARVVTLYDLEGRPVEEVADALERSPGAVFLLRIRAHRRLGEIMGTAADYFTDSP